MWHDVEETGRGQTAGSQIQKSLIQRSGREQLVFQRMNKLKPTGGYVNLFYLTLFFFFKVYVRNKPHASQKTKPQDFLEKSRYLQTIQENSAK